MATFKQILNSNLPPLADAGADQRVLVGNVANFDTSVSFDPDIDEKDFVAGVHIDFDDGFYEGLTSHKVEHWCTYLSEQNAYSRADDHFCLPGLLNLFNVDPVIILTTGTSGIVYNTLDALDNFVPSIEQTYTISESDFNRLSDLGLEIYRIKILHDKNTIISGDFNISSSIQEFVSFPMELEKSNASKLLMKFYNNNIGGLSITNEGTVNLNFNLSDTVDNVETTKTPIRNQTSAKFDGNLRIFASTNSVENFRDFQKFKIDFWINSATNPTTDESIFFNRRNRSENFGLSNDGFEILRIAGGTGYVIHFTAQIPLVLATYDLFSSDLEVDKWYLITITFDSEDLTTGLKLYVNGILDGSSPAGPIEYDVQLSNEGRNVTFGQRYATDMAPFELVPDSFLNASFSNFRFNTNDTAPTEFLVGGLDKIISVGDKVVLDVMQYCNQKKQPDNSTSDAHALYDTVYEVSDSGAPRLSIHEFIKTPYGFADAAYELLELEGKNLCHFNGLEKLETLPGSEQIVYYEAPVFDQNDDRYFSRLQKGALSILKTEDNSYARHEFNSLLLDFNHVKYIESKDVSVTITRKINSAAVFSQILPNLSIGKIFHTRGEGQVSIIPLSIELKNSVTLDTDFVMEIVPDTTTVKDVFDKLTTFGMEWNNDAAFKSWTILNIDESYNTERVTFSDKSSNMGLVENDGFSANTNVNNPFTLKYNRKFSIDPLPSNPTEAFSIVFEAEDLVDVFTDALYDFDIKYDFYIDLAQESDPRIFEDDFIRIDANPYLILSVANDTGSSGATVNIVNSVEDVNVGDVFIKNGDGATEYVVNSIDLVANSVIFNDPAGFNTSTFFRRVRLSDNRFDPRFSTLITDTSSSSDNTLRLTNIPFEFVVKDSNIESIVHIKNLTNGRIYYSRVIDDGGESVGQDNVIISNNRVKIVDSDILITEPPEKTDSVEIAYTHNNFRYPNLLKPDGTFNVEGAFLIKTLFEKTINFSSSTPFSSIDLDEKPYDIVSFVLEGPSPDFLSAINYITIENRTLLLFDEFDDPALVGNNSSNPFVITYRYHRFVPVSQIPHQYGLQEFGKKEITVGVVSDTKQTDLDVSNVFLVAQHLVNTENLYDFGISNLDKSEAIDAATTLSFVADNTRNRGTNRFRLGDEIKVFVGTEPFFAGVIQKITPETGEGGDSISVECNSSYQNLQNRFVSYFYRSAELLLNRTFEDVVKDIVYKQANISPYTSSEEQIIHFNSPAAVLSDVSPLEVWVDIPKTVPDFFSASIVYPEIINIYQPELQSKPRIRSDGPVLLDLNRSESNLHAKSITEFFQNLSSIAKDWEKIDNDENIAKNINRYSLKIDRPVLHPFYSNPIKYTDAGELDYFGDSLSTIDSSRLANVESGNLKYVLLANDSELYGGFLTEEPYEFIVYAKKGSETKLTRKTIVIDIEELNIDDDNVFIDHLNGRIYYRGADFTGMAIRAYMIPMVGKLHSRKSSSDDFSGNITIEDEKIVIIIPGFNIAEIVTTLVNNSPVNVLRIENTRHSEGAKRSCKIIINNTGNLSFGTYNITAFVYEYNTANLRLFFDVNGGLIIKRDHAEDADPVDITTTDMVSIEHNILYAPIDIPEFNSDRYSFDENLSTDENEKDFISYRLYPSSKVSTGVPNIPSVVGEIFKKIAGNVLKDFDLIGRAPPFTNGLPGEGSDGGISKRTISVYDKDETPGISNGVLDNKFVVGISNNAGILEMSDSSIGKIIEVFDQKTRESYYSPRVARLVDGKEVDHVLIFNASVSNIKHTLRRYTFSVNDEGNTVIGNGIVLQPGMHVLTNGTVNRILFIDGADITFDNEFDVVNPGGTVLVSGNIVIAGSNSILKLNSTAASSVGDMIGKYIRFKRTPTEFEIAKILYTVVNDSFTFAYLDKEVTIDIGDENGIFVIYNGFVLETTIESVPNLPIVKIEFDNNELEFSVMLPSVDTTVAIVDLNPVGEDIKIGDFFISDEHSGKVFRLIDFDTTTLFFETDGPFSVDSVLTRLRSKQDTINAIEFRAPFDNQILFPKYAIKRTVQIHRMADSDFDIYLDYTFFRSIPIDTTLDIDDQFLQIFEGLYIDIDDAFFASTSDLIQFDIISVIDNTIQVQYNEFDHLYYTWVAKKTRRNFDKEIVFIDDEETIDFIDIIDSGFQKFFTNLNNSHVNIVDYIGTVQNIIDRDDPTQNDYTKLLNSFGDSPLDINNPKLGDEVIIRDVNKITNNTKIANITVENPTEGIISFESRLGIDNDYIAEYSYGNTFLNKDYPFRYVPASEAISTLAEAIEYDTRVQFARQSEPIIFTDNVPITFNLPRKSDSTLTTRNFLDPKYGFPNDEDGSTFLSLTVGRDKKFPNFYRRKPYANIEQDEQLKTYFANIRDRFSVDTLKELLTPFNLVSNPFTLNEFYGDIGLLIQLKDELTGGITRYYINDDVRSLQCPNHLEEGEDSNGFCKVCGNISAPYKFFGKDLNVPGIVIGGYSATATEILVNSNIAYRHIEISGEFYTVVSSKVDTTGGATHRLFLNRELGIVVPDSTTVLGTKTQFVIPDIQMSFTRNYNENSPAVTNLSSFYNLSRSKSFAILNGGILNNLPILNNRVVEIVTQLAGESTITTTGIIDGSSDPKVYVRETDTVRVIANRGQPQILILNDTFTGQFIEIIFGDDESDIYSIGSSSGGLFNVTTRLKRTLVPGEIIKARDEDLFVSIDLPKTINTSVAGADRELEVIYKSTNAFRIKNPFYEGSYHRIDEITDLVSWDNENTEDLFVPSNASIRSFPLEFTEISNEDKTGLGSHQSSSVSFFYTQDDPSGPSPTYNPVSELDNNPFNVEVSILPSAAGQYQIIYEEGSIFTFDSVGINDTVAYTKTALPIIVKGFRAVYSYKDDLTSTINYAGNDTATNVFLDESLDIDTLQPSIFADLLVDNKTEYSTNYSLRETQTIQDTENVKYTLDVGLNGKTAIRRFLHYEKDPKNYLIFKKKHVAEDIDLEENNLLPDFQHALNISSDSLIMDRNQIATRVTAKGDSDLIVSLENPTSRLRYGLIEDFTEKQELKTYDDLVDFAVNRLNETSEEIKTGSLEVVGNPAIHAGDIISVLDSHTGFNKENEPNTKEFFRVIQVSQSFSSDGFSTSLSLDNQIPRLASILYQMKAKVQERSQEAESAINYAQPITDLIKLNVSVNNLLEPQIARFGADFFSHTAHGSIVRLPPDNQNTGGGEYAIIDDPALNIDNAIRQGENEKLLASSIQNGLINSLPVNYDIDPLIIDSTDIILSNTTNFISTGIKFINSYSDTNDSFYINLSSALSTISSIEMGDDIILLPLDISFLPFVYIANTPKELSSTNLYRIISAGTATVTRGDNTITAFKYRIVPGAFEAFGAETSVVIDPKVIQIPYEIDDDNITNEEYKLVALFHGQNEAGSRQFVSYNLVLNDPVVLKTVDEVIVLDEVHESVFGHSDETIADLTTFVNDRQDGAVLLAISDNYASGTGLMIDPFDPDYYVYPEGTTFYFASETFISGTVDNYNVLSNMGETFDKGFITLPEDVSPSVGKNIYVTYKIKKELRFFSFLLSEQNTSDIIDKGQFFQIKIRFKYLDGNFTEYIPIANYVGHWRKISVDLKEAGIYNDREISEIEIRIEYVLKKDQANFQVTDTNRNLATYTSKLSNAPGDHFPVNLRFAGFRFQ